MRRSLWIVAYRAQSVYYGVSKATGEGLEYAPFQVLTNLGTVLPSNVKWIVANHSTAEPRIFYRK